MSQRAVFPAIPRGLEDVHGSGLETLAERNQFATKAAVIRGRSRPILQHASVAPFPAEARDAEAATNHVKQKRWHERAREMGRAASTAQRGRAKLRPGLELAVQKGISR